MDAYGRIQTSLPRDQAAFEMVEIQVEPPPTRTERIAILLLPIAGGAVVGSGLMLWRQP